MEIQPCRHANVTRERALPTTRDFPQNAHCQTNAAATPTPINYYLMSITARCYTAALHSDCCICQIIQRRKCANCKARGSSLERPPLQMVEMPMLSAPSLSFCRCCCRSSLSAHISRGALRERSPQVSPDPRSHVCTAILRGNVTEGNRHN